MNRTLVIALAYVLWMQALVGCVLLLTSAPSPSVESSALCLIHGTPSVACDRLVEMARKGEK